jgi:NADH:ubiquinone oxidoreductase subunit 3 (subunit A)
MKKIIPSLLITFSVIYASCYLAQLWFSLFKKNIFSKITTSYFVVMALVGFIYAVKKRFEEEETLKKNKFISD